MARIAGVELPPNKRIEIGLTYIYGIGRSQANNILTSSGVHPDTKVRELNDDQVNKILGPIEGNPHADLDSNQRWYHRWAAEVRNPSR